MSVPLVVIIPSKTASNLAPCLQAIHKHEKGIRTIVIDDGLDVDWDPDTLIKPWAEVIGGIKPFVFSRNINIGIRAAGEAADVILLNDDALLETPGGFTIMQRDAESDPRIGIIGATTNVTGQHLQQRRPLQPGAPNTRVVEHFAFVCVLIPARTRASLAQWTEQADNDGNLLGRIYSGGYLDERYCIDYGVEDRDYCEQVRAVGLRCAVSDACFVDHSKLRSSFRGDPEAPRPFAQNYELFKKKWGVTA